LFSAESQRNTINSGQVPATEITSSMEAESKLEELCVKRK
jgi:hypothetical protein